MTTSSANKPTRSQRNTSSTWFSPLDRFFRQDFTDFLDISNPLTIPALNIHEDREFFHIEMAAPGLKKEDFVVEIEGKTLTISCEKELENNQPGENKNYARREYNYTTFSRSFTLPENVNMEKIDASYSQGI